MSKIGNILEIEKLYFNWKTNNSFTLNINNLILKNRKKVVLLGESGSGKSTLLNLISGIIEPERGKIYINGTLISSLSKKQKDSFRNENLGVIFQRFNILDYLSPLSNILLPFYFSSLNKDNINYYKNRVFVLAERLNINKNLLFQTNSKDLSVGQQQRIAIMRALINSPKIIIADEPTSSLDYKNKEKFLSLLFQICNQEGISLLMVTHDSTISKYFDETLILENLNKKI